MLGKKSEPPQVILTLAPNVDAVRQDDAAASASPCSLVNVGLSRRQKTGALVAHEFALSGTHAHTVVRPVRLPKLKGRAGPTLRMCWRD